MKLHLISHTLCPYVQRAVISLLEKQVKFDRTYIDLSNKPDWFLAISPLGKTPVLQAGDASVFESALIDVIPSLIMLFLKDSDSRVDIESSTS